MSQGLQAPEASFFFCERSSLQTNRFPIQLRPRDTIPDPRFQIGDLLLGQPFVRRHLKRLVADGLQQQTPDRLTCHHRGAGFSPVQQTLQ